MEAGNHAFRIARYLAGDSDCHVLVLNPGDVATIYQSVKKTDKEDSLKLARLIARFPEEELPVVRVPDEERENIRSLLRERERLSGIITKSKNALHAAYTRAGITQLSKLEIQGKLRWKALEHLSGPPHIEAERALKLIEFTEGQLREIDEQIHDYLINKKGYAAIALSIPGVGPITALTFYAFLGDCSQFSSGSQVSYYAGLVPRVDISGDTVRYGHIIRRGNSLLRRPLVQAAWALIRSEYGGPLKDFYLRLGTRIGKKKAIVATARKMLEIFYAMIRSGEFYSTMPQDVLDEKLRRYVLV